MRDAEANARPVAAGDRRSSRMGATSPLAEIAVSDPSVASPGDDGTIVVAAGGSADVTVTVGGRVVGLEIRSSLAPAISALEVAPGNLLLRSIGEASGLGVTAVMSDGSRRPLVASDAPTFEAEDPGVLAVSPAGVVTALAAGSSRVIIRAGLASTSADVEVDPFATPDLARISFERVEYRLATDRAPAVATAVLAGNGSLDGLPVRFQLTGPGVDLVQTTTSDRAASAYFELADLPAPGPFTLSASVIDPQDGSELSASVPVAIEERNRDAEPNDSIASAVVATPGARLQGALSPADSADFYRLELALPGALAVRVEADADVRVALLAADGSALAEATGGAEPLELSAPTGGADLFVVVHAEGGASTYRVSTRLVQEPPAITAIEPASAPPGAIVTIRGSGFSPRPRLTPSCSTLLSEVRSASTSALEGYRSRVHADRTRARLGALVGR
jgi:hypothetical protein